MLGTQVRRRRVDRIRIDDLAGLGRDISRTILVVGYGQQPFPARHLPVDFVDCHRGAE